MAGQTELEQIAIQKRNELMAANLYKNNDSDKYKETHNRALGDGDIHGKGTGIFLDTTNGGGDLDINGNPSYPGSGRIGNVVINDYQKGSNEYNATNPDALATGDVQGKGTGEANNGQHINVDTDAGGLYDINGHPFYPNSGRVKSLLTNEYQKGSNEYTYPDMSANEAAGQVDVQSVSPII